MLFVYKTGQSLSKYQGFRRKLICYTGTSFFKLITTLDFFCVQYAPFKATSSTFKPFWHHLLFFMHLQICFELNDPKIEKHYKCTLKRLNLGMVSLIHRHSMCEKVERVTTKIGCTSCTKLDNLFRSIRVSDENSSVTPALHFLNLLQLQTFFAFSMQHSKPRHQLSTLFDVICYFSCIYRFVLS